MRALWTGSAAVFGILLLGCVASPTRHQAQDEVAVSSKNKSDYSLAERKSHQEKLTSLQTESQGLSNRTGEENKTMKGENNGIIESETSIKKAKRTRKTIKRKRVSRRKKSRKSSSSSKRKSKVVTVTSMVDPNSVSTNIFQSLNTSQNLPIQIPIENPSKNVTHILKDVPVANLTNLDRFDKGISSKRNISALNVSIGEKENITKAPEILSTNLILPTNLTQNISKNVEVSDQITTEPPIPTIKPTKPRFFLIRETTTTENPSIKSLARRPSVLINKFSSSKSSKRRSSHVSSSSTTHEISEVIVHEYDFTDVATKKPKAIRKDGGPRFFLIRDNPSNSSEKVKPLRIPKIVPRRIVSKVSKTQTSSTSTNSTSEETSSSLKQILIKGEVKNNLTQQSGNQNSSLETKSKTSSNTTESETRNEENNVSKNLGTETLALNSQQGNEDVAQAIGNYSAENTKRTKNLRKSLRRSRKVSRKKKKSKVSKKSSSSKTVMTDATINTIST